MKKLSRAKRKIHKLIDRMFCYIFLGSAFVKRMDSLNQDILEMKKKAGPSENYHGFDKWLNNWYWHGKEVANEDEFNRYEFCKAFM